MQKSEDRGMMVCDLPQLHTYLHKGKTSQSLLRFLPALRSNWQSQKQGCEIFVHTPTLIIITIKVMGFNVHCIRYSNLTRFQLMIYDLEEKREDEDEEEEKGEEKRKKTTIEK